MEYPNRKLPRLKGYDYSSPRYYFATICTHEKRHIFGKCNKLNHFGNIAKTQMEAIAGHYEHVFVDKYVIMPNHIHAIIVIEAYSAERSRPFPTLSTIIGQYKSGVARTIHATAPDMIVWQKSFHDHVIRNEHDYLNIWQYIDTNPLTWETDCFYTEEEITQ